MSVVEGSRLGKRYGGRWALWECTFSIPAGHVVALVGPNGAGKTTLLQLAVGLSLPTSGRIQVLDGQVPGSKQARGRIAFMAQGAALYQNLSVGDTLRLGRSLNRRWDDEQARAHLSELDIPLRQKVGALSGGQQAQLALALVLAKHPELLILDEPLALLDPLARHTLLATVMTAVAEGDLSVVLSSHAVTEVERVCDRLIVLSSGQVQMSGGVEDLLAEHRMLIGPAAQADAVTAVLPVVSDRRAAAQAHLLARVVDPIAATPPGWESHRIGLEELVLAYLRRPGVSALPGPVAVTS